MKINKYAFIILSALLVNTAFADEMEEIIVSSSLVKSTISNMFTYFAHAFLTYMNGLGKELNI